MLNKISLRWRLTLLSTVLLTLITILLTMTLNYRTYEALKSIQAAPVVPSMGMGQASTPSLIVVEEAKMTYQDSSKWIMLGFIISGSMLTYVISGRALKPLDSLTKEIQEVKDRPLKNKISIPDTNDEIATLTHSFNVMMSDLNKSFEAQERFSANAAHELRTPLAIMQTQLDVYQKSQTQSKEDETSLIQSFDTQIKRLRGIVQNLLQLSSHQVIEKTKFNVDDLVLDVLDNFSELALKKNISIQDNLEFAELNANPELMYQAIFNLIDNAVYYSPNNSIIKCSLKQERNMTVLSIENDYHDINMEALQKLTEPFYQLDDSRSNQDARSGLGLALVKHIIEIHQGKLILQSKDHTFKASIIL